MNNKKLFYIGLITILALGGCKKETHFLDKTPDEDLTIGDVFTQYRYAESFLTSLYANLPREINMSDQSGLDPFVAATDEMDISYTYPYSHNMVSGNWGPSDITSNPGGYINIWANSYQAIRKANIFLENVDKIPLSPPEFTKEQRDTWKGEALFLRAFQHFLLMRIFGPIPISGNSYTIAQDFTKLKRQPLEDCINFVVNQCDTAASFLPMKITDHSDYGRVTAAAALALKARVLLYAASPLWNGNPDYAGFEDKDGVALFPATYDKEKWEKAYEAAKACIDLTEAAGYGIFGQYNTDPVKTREDLFLINNNNEIFFARNMGFSTLIETASSPVSYGGNAGYCPTQEIVDAYQMDNGETPITGYNQDQSPKIAAASGYTETGFAAAADPNGNYPAGTSNMYVGREPRFYADIHFSGSMWRGTQMQFWNSGKDGHGSGSSSYPVTGYLIKKFSDPSVNPQNLTSSGVLKTWVYFRLGEQYLNYAEALNEYAGPVADVYKYVDLIRLRAGLPNLPAGLSQEDMRKRIRHERRIELAFETHRYFDLRRWKLAATVDDQDVYGMNTHAGTSLQDPSFYERKKIETRIFTAPKDYLWPIPQSEINKDQNLVQNPGW
jgi:hypothetical protein